MVRRRRRATTKAAAMSPSFTRNTGVAPLVEASAPNSSSPEAMLNPAPVQSARNITASGPSGTCGATPSSRRSKAAFAPTSRLMPTVCVASTVGYAHSDPDSRTHVDTAVASSQSSRSCTAT